MASGEVPPVPDPDDRNRHVRAHAILARLLNDLIQAGFIVNTGDTYTIVLGDTAGRSVPPGGIYDCGCDETMIVVGPPGPTGATGATGPPGPGGDGASSGSMMVSDFEVDEPPLRPFINTLNDVGAPIASFQFNGQQALTFRIENRTSDPGSPSAGQIWLRTDL